MSKIFIATRGIESWRQRLANPDRHWRRRYSAFETAVSWECASLQGGGLPVCFVEMFAGTQYAPVGLFAAVAEHKVPLAGGSACSQCDVWAVLHTAQGLLSLSVEAKARGGVRQRDVGQVAPGKRVRGIPDESSESVAGYPGPPSTDRGSRGTALSAIAPLRCRRHQAKRLRLGHAAFVVQCFGQGDANFGEFARFCGALGVAANRGTLDFTNVHTAEGEIKLGVGWVHCEFASDAQVLAVV